MCWCPERVRQRGISLVEVILFIVIVGSAVGGVMGLYMTTMRSSADPLIRKQALAIAESLLEEVRLKPFTDCDPDDPNVYTPSAACTIAEGIGPDGGETRYSGTSPFDNVNDYHNFSTATAIPAGICDLDASCIAALAGYTASITVVPTAFNGIAASDALLITVTVTGPTGEAIALSAFRTRHAPNF